MYNVKRVCRYWQATVLSLVVGMTAVTGALAQDTGSGTRRQAPGGSGRDVVQTAASSPSFTTLVSALKAADLTTALSGSGPFTVFAPTNEAFDALPAGTLDDLLQPANKAKLTSLLRYHVVAGQYPTEKLEDGQTLKTLSGETLTVAKQDGTVTINGAEVIQADAPASNGVIHVIGSVLAPGGN